MKTQLSKLLERLRSSYWFVPSLLAAFAMLLSYGVTRLDAALRLDLKRSYWLYTGDASGGMEVLSAIASAAVTIASLTFSVTIVALTLAASQYGPRLLYNFMRDRSNQLVLGVFVGAFLYSLMVLRTIQGADTTFVPQLAITLALVWALVGIGALIYFIHHTAETIQADNLIAAVSRELTLCVQQLFAPLEKEPEYQREAEEGRAHWERVRVDSAAVRAEESGFLQAIDTEALERIARKRDLVVRVLRRPGEIITREDHLAAIHPAAAVDARLVETINGAFTLGARRTLIQDIELPFQQLVEVAVRGLSPGVYDPFTALRCIARLCDGLIQIMKRTEPCQVRRDSDGRLRVLLCVAGFASIAEFCFGELRAYGAPNSLVMKELLRAVHGLLLHARNDTQRRVLLQQAKWIYEASSAQAPNEVARHSLDHAYAPLLNFSEQMAVRAPQAH